MRGRRRPFRAPPLPFPAAPSPRRRPRQIGGVCLAGRRAAGLGVGVEAVSEECTEVVAGLAVEDEVVLVEGFFRVG